MKTYKILLPALALVATLAGTSSHAQVRTAYFMDNSIVRTQMNPALTPTRGYVNIPAISGIGAEVTSNTMSLDKLFYKNPRPGESGLVTFLDNDIAADALMSALKDRNNLNVTSNINVLGLGFYSGKAFWTFDVNIKTNFGVTLPKGLFEFAKRGNTPSNELKTKYNMKDVEIYSDSYSEFALGYSRPMMNNRLTVGGRVKFLAGLANASMKYDYINITLERELWAVEASGEMNVSISGLEYKTKQENPGTPGTNDYIDMESIDIEPKKFAGYGAGIDLGASYKLLDNLTISAAVLDLGFVTWDAKNTLSANSAQQYSFTGLELQSDNSNVGDIDQLAHFYEKDSKSRTTMLNTTVNAGAEYSLMNNFISFGLLSSTQFRATVPYSELTASAVIRPTKWFSGSVSYSMMHSRFQTLGAAVCFSPSWINFFVGSDYIIGKTTKQGIPLKQQASNIYFGIGIPLKARPY